MVARALEDRAAAGGVGAANARLAKDEAASWEVRALHMLHQPFRADCRIIHVGAARGEHLAEIVRRDVGRHADGDAAGAVDQQIGEARRKHLRLALRRIVIGLELDRVLVDVPEEEIGDLGEPRFSVSHGRRRVRVHRAEIALAVDQRHAHRPILGHSRERVVDRLVSVRVILTHDIADDAARLAVRPAGDIARFLAGEEDPAVDGLQAIAHVGQRAADDDAHRIVEVAGLHLLDDGDGRDVVVPRRRGRAVGPVVGRRFGGQLDVLSLRGALEGAARLPPPEILSRASNPEAPPRARTRAREAHRPVQTRFRPIRSWVLACILNGTNRARGGR